MADQTVTQQQIKSLYHYDPDTGIFTRRGGVWGGPRGSIAGRPTGVGYGAIVIEGRRNYTHRLAWIYVYGHLDPNQTLDHIDGDPTNNCICNLRLATPGENAKNTGVGRKNTTGVLGVVWHKRLQRWQAGITCNHLVEHLGTFDNLLDAVCARRSAEARLGFHPNHGKRKSAFLQDVDATVKEYRKALKSASNRPLYCPYTA